jgi:subtilisin family serine protease
VNPLVKFLTALALLVAAVHAQQLISAEIDPANASAAASPREILLTFTDRGLLRTNNFGPGQYYRRTGSYQATTWSRTVSADLARDYLLSTVVEWPIRALNVHCVVYTVDESQSVDAVMERLRSDTRVKSVQRMNTFRALGSEDPYKPLQSSFNAMQVEAVQQWATGAGIRIAIIDTGVDVDHPDLAGQVAERMDLTGSHLDFEDDIHGTAIAGIIGALSENGLGIAGVAPDARLLALRACWPERSGAIAAVCNSLSLARALDTAISLRPGIINLSLTGPPDPLIAELLQVALREGIIIVAAEPETASEPGFIAGIDGIIRVLADSAQDVEQQQRPAGAAIVAPGNDVLTTFPHGTYNFVRGSSFAAANVSGVIALLLQLQPELTSQRVEELLSLGLGEASIRGTRAVTVNVCRMAAQLRPQVECTDGGSSRLLVQKYSKDNFGI